MKKVLFVRKKGHKYSDEDVLKIYECINKIKKDKNLELHFCDDNYLIDILTKANTNNIKKIVNFKNEQNAIEVMEYAKENKIKHIILMGVGHNFVLTFKMGAYVYKINIYAF